MVITVFVAIWLIFVDYKTMTADTEEGISKLHTLFLVCWDKAREHERLPLSLSRGDLNTLGWLLLCVAITYNNNNNNKNNKKNISLLLPLFQYCVTALKQQSSSSQ